MKLCSPVVLLVAATAAWARPSSAPSAAQQYIINGGNVSDEFDGHGGLSAGATTRLLVDYPEKERAEILDYLFKPGFGASLGVLKLEIGGDTQSTCGTEPSPMHARGQVDCAAGYEGWLAREARARNPEIKVWSLSWGVPGWIGNHSYYSDEDMAYHIEWLKCLNNTYGVQSDYLGMWNERPQGSVDYVVRLREALDRSGFERVGLTIEASWQELIGNVLTNATFNASVAAAAKHYPCNETVESALEARKKVWSGEDSPTPFGNWTGASCWGRKLNQHWVKMRMTSVVSWAVVWSVYPQICTAFVGQAFVNATQPWTGHYDVPPVLWVTAHWGQFVSPGWRYLAVGPNGGSGMLRDGGSYVTLVPPVGSKFPSDTFTLIIETLTGSCTSPSRCDVGYPDLGTQQIEFRLARPLDSARAVYLWCSNETNVFEYQGQVPVSNDGVLAMTMPPDTICTASTRNVGQKGGFGEPPAARRFPPTHADNFSAYEDGDLAFGFSDMYGSFAVRSSGDGVDSSAPTKALTQLATDSPDGWAPLNFDPLTIIGDGLWTDVNVSVSAIVNHTSEQGHYVRVCGGCYDGSVHRIEYFCPDSCCFNLTSTGNYSIGTAVQGKIAGFQDTWHRIDLGIVDGTVSAAVDGETVARSQAGECTGRGYVGLGCGKYHQCAFTDFKLRAASSKF